MDSIILTDISHMYGKKLVLDGIDMHIAKGSIYGLLGPSGCGKTTMVKIMAGLLCASSGKVEVLGEVMPQLAMLKRIGYMAQSDALYQTLSAEENIQFFGALYGLPKKEINIRRQMILQLVGLEGVGKQPVRFFSGGMKRRLSLAIALLPQPEVLILDEPTVGIDPVLRRKIWQALRQLADEGTTIMLTTHVMDEALQCDRLAMMRLGKITAEDTPEALMRSAGVENIEDAFIYYGGA